LLTFGVLVRAGEVRYWWAVPYYAAGQEPFIALPGGLSCLFLFIAMVLPSQSVFLYLAIGCGLLALVFLILKPRFLKPEWLQWLEDHHKEHIPILRREARQMGAFQWARRVKTQAGLEQWVEEVLRGHGLG
jgi:hypothetical protein